MTPPAVRRSDRLAVGLDFGTESVRALVVDLEGGERGVGVVPFRHGQITETLPGTAKRLPPRFALQHPDDWLDAAGRASRKALRAAGARPDEVAGVGVDFTSCTVLPTDASGVPLASRARFAERPHAWPKLWKHHGAVEATARIDAVATRRGEAWLARYGGQVGLEWSLPKLLEVLEDDPRVFEATERWIEAGDWLVWQLVGGDEPARSTCQAGYKALWNRTDGYPDRAFLRAVHRGLGHAGELYAGRLVPPGEPAGELTAAAARTLGLRAGTPVSAAIIDAHAGVPGAGVAEPGVLVLVLGTSACHMLMAEEERLVPGVAGVVADGILPGLYGYETGQAAVGDAFDWVRRLAGERDFARLDEAARALPPGAEGVVAVDWLNGCRTPLMDGALGGGFAGLSLAHGPEHLYRAMVEATALGLRWIVDLLRDGGVPVRRVVATGGLPHANPLVPEVYADALGLPLAVHGSTQGPALGAAILGALAAGAFRSPRAAVRAMAGPGLREARAVRPRKGSRGAYEALYARYRALAESLQADATLASGTAR